MANEIVCTGQLTDAEFLVLLKACYDARMFSGALVLAEQFPRHVIKRREQQDLLFFSDASSPVPWNDAQVIPWHTYLSGRIFTEQWELRWMRQPEGIRVVYLGSSEHSGTLRDHKLNICLNDKGEPPIPDGTQVKSYYLFGKRLSLTDADKIGAKLGDFAEARIPRLLRYPAANYSKQDTDRALKMPYMQLRVLEYIDKAGCVVLSRFQCLSTIEEEQHESV
jgi:hypothetical protein